MVNWPAIIRLENGNLHWCASEILITAVPTGAPNGRPWTIIHTHTPDGDVLHLVLFRGMIKQVFMSSPEFIHKWALRDLMVVKHTPAGITVVG